MENDAVAQWIFEQPGRLQVVIYSCTIERVGQVSHIKSTASLSRFSVEYQEPVNFMEKLKMHECTVQWEEQTPAHVTHVTQNTPYLTKIGVAWKNISQQKGYLLRSYGRWSSWAWTHVWSFFALAVATGRWIVWVMSTARSYGNTTSLLAYWWEVCASATYSWLSLIRWNVCKHKL